MRWIAGFLALLWLAPVQAQTPEQKQETIAYLRKLQTPSGGFLADAKAEKPGLRATSAAVRALKYFGSPLQDAKSARDFVTQCFRPKLGAFLDQPDSSAPPDVTTTAIGLMAVVELHIPFEMFQARAVTYLEQQAREFPDIRIAAAGLEAVRVQPPQAEVWLKKLIAGRNPDGTFGGNGDLAWTTGSWLVTVLRLGGKVENREHVLRVLRDGQRPDGGFGKSGPGGSELESAYRIMRAFAMLKEKPKDVEGLRKFIARCRNADGGYGVAPGQGSSVSGTYYAGIILHWLEMN
jgi:prenyltransferase beta subunit